MNTTKIALITGASGDLGREMTLALARAGWDLILTYRSGRAKAESLVTEVAALGRRAELLALDFDAPDWPAFRALVEQTLEQRWGSRTLTALVSNAGFGSHQSVGTITEEAIDALHRVHFKGPTLLIQTLLPLLASGSSILATTTGLDRFSLPGYGVYSAMKGAMEVFFRYLAKELGPRGIRANTLAPGAIDNEFNRQSFEANPAMRGIISSVTALGRVGRSDDIGSVAAFLVSDEARWITGQRLEVSGGMFL